MGQTSMQIPQLMHAPSSTVTANSLAITKPPRPMAERATMIFDGNDCHVVLDPIAEERLAWQGASRTGLAV